MKCILEIDVKLDSTQITSFQGPAGGVTLLPFTGTAQGEIFNGTVCPGGVDVQRSTPDGACSLCARYILKGTDYTGAPCHIYIENTGWFNNEPTFKTTPTLLTDSPSLSDRLHHGTYTGEGIPMESGVLIRIYEK